MRRVADTGPGALTSSRRPVEHLAAVAELPRKCPHRLLPSPTIGAEQSAGWHAATQGRGSAKGTGPVFTRSHGRASPRNVEHCDSGEGWLHPPLDPPAAAPETARPGRGRPAAAREQVQPGAVRRGPAAHGPAPARGLDDAVAALSRACVARGLGHNAFFDRRFRKDQRNG